MTSHVYGTEFMGVTSLSRLSAQKIVPAVQGLMAEGHSITSVADFGCALGTWLSVWQQAGVADVQGVDGDYLKGQALEFDAALIRLDDLTRHIDLGRRFDLVQSLEVAEHLPLAAAATFVATLVRHGDIVLFSAAPPGQGGEYHVNEQSYGFWRDLFAGHGYALFDAVRGMIAGDDSIRYWYRYNSFLFVKESAISRLKPAVAASRISPGAAVPDISPPLFKLRKAAVRQMPQAMSHGIAGLLSRIRTRG
jgi:hypothetical protein